MSPARTVANPSFPTSFAETATSNLNNSRQVKTSADPRHLNRIKAFKQIFSKSFIDQEIDNELAREASQHQIEIDEIIVKCAPEWPLTQINRVDLSVLRLAIFELLYRPDVPTKVILDEAVEIAKRYGGQSSSSFVNGALATALNLTNRNTNDNHHDQK